MEHSTELERMYARTEHWISDYAFFEDEFKFLFNLVDRFFIGLVLSDSNKLEILKSIGKNLLKLDNEREFIEKENRQNLAYIARLIKNEEAFEITEFRENQSDMESDQVVFLKKYRAIKNEIFQLSKHLIDSNERKTIMVKSKGRKAQEKVALTTRRDPDR